MTLRKIQIKNKKGVSEIIAYVLLILIAVSISVLVYAWLKVQVPKEKTTCPEGIAITIKSYSCEAGKKINISFENRGLFNIDGINVLIANVSGETPGNTINASSSLGNPVQTEGFVYFNPALPPRKAWEDRFDYSSSGVLRRIQITPFVFEEKSDGKNNELILCKDAIIIQDVSCD